MGFWINFQFKIVGVKGKLDFLQHLLCGTSSSLGHFLSELSHNIGWIWPCVLSETEQLANSGSVDTLVLGAQSIQIVQWSR